MTVATYGRQYAHPYDRIAADLADGRRVVVFCDNAKQAYRAINEVAYALTRMGVESISRSYSLRTVRAQDGLARFVIANDQDGRGLTSDVAYVSESVHMQYDYARLMNAEIRH